MKILKRNNEFKKVQERNLEDVENVRQLLNQGWNYCSKSEYKSATRIEVVEKPKKSKKKVTKK